MVYVNDNYTIDFTSSLYRTKLWHINTKKAKPKDYYNVLLEGTADEIPACWQHWRGEVIQDISQIFESLPSARKNMFRDTSYITTDKTHTQCYTHYQETKRLKN